MRDLVVSRYCDCPFSAVIDFAEKTLEHQRGMQVSPGPALTENVIHSTKLVGDRTDRARLHDALLLVWKPEHRTVFPDFHGVLTVRPLRRGASIRLQGRYEPPFGVAGKLFDAVAGRYIAKRTLKRLLDQLVVDIEARYVIERLMNRHREVSGCHPERAPRGAPVEGRPSEVEAR